MEDRIALKIAVLFADKRKKQGLTQEALANAVSVHRTTISRVERGVFSPPLVLCFKLARILDVDLAKIVEKAQTQ